jgi:CRISPR-associated endoribonuclease Cas6
MRFVIDLLALAPSQHITLNYQYPLSAAIYKIIQRADEDYAAFLHNKGYTNGSKHFKLFTFSDLRTPFFIHGGNMVMRTTAASFTVCFHMPDAAENFVQGLFMHQQLEIANSTCKASFVVKQVIAQKNDWPQGYPVLLQPKSPLVAGRKNERGNYDYVSPEEGDFADLITGNLMEKYASINEVDDATLEKIRSETSLHPVFFNHPPRHRLLTIKEGTAAQTKVRGFDKFRIKLTAPEAIINLALDAGLGIHNAMGMGCVELGGKG